MNRYSVKEITEKNIWEEFLLSHHPNTFLQSWSWGEFNISLGRKIWRLGVFEVSKLVSIALIVKIPTRFGPYLYLPRGPVWQFSNWEVFNSLFSEIKRIAVEERAIFVKLDPQIIDEPSVNQEFKKKGFKRGVGFVQVEDAWLLDLTKSEDQLLSEMRKTARYLIRQEAKQGVKIEISSKTEDAQTFVDLLSKTASRKSFVNHPSDYYLKQFEVMGPENQERVFIARKNGKVNAMAIICFYGESAYYLHGASNPQEGQSSGYLLQWEAIREAKRRGMNYYSFWGVVKDKNFVPKHPWYGFSLFKKGFGGYKESYIRAQDFPISPKYYVYRTAERLRRLKNRVQTGFWED
jgi:peptidoglycan pentaglycine glycine transferase (the first glycine)